MKNKEEVLLASVLAEARIQIQEDHDGLLELCKEESETDVGVFVAKALDWYSGNDKDNKQLLWEIFHEVVSMDERNFMRSFGGFVVNCLLDDGCFRVEWRKNCSNGKGSLIYLKNGSVKTVLADKSDPDSDPVVVLGGDDGSQNPMLLLEAMDLKKGRFCEYVKRTEEFIKELHNK